MAATALPGRRLPAQGPSGSSPHLRRFEAAIFDWDGTAVPDRRADARAVRALVEELSRLGFEIGVVSGTHLGNVDPQLAARPDGPGALYLCLNRGSEVFRVGPDGPVLAWSRKATGAEDEALTAAAAATVAELRERGLTAEVVAERLNRRKIDLIPEPAWADPAKERIDELVTAVEARLHARGFESLSEVAEIARRAAARAGLVDARVTSDVKHVEIGLTDKSDSAAWLFAELADRGVDPQDVLVIGDELGPLAGLPGSDSLMLAAANGATAVSVGVEPAGVPDGVLALGGGPPAFVAILEQQILHRRGGVPAVRATPGWSITFDGLDPGLERARESLLTIGDGRVGISGAPLLQHAAATPEALLNGVYDGDGAGSHLLACPTWTTLREPLARDDALTRSLDLRRGLLFESVGGPRHTLSSVRFAPLARPGAGVLRISGKRQAPDGEPLARPRSRKPWSAGRRAGVACLKTEVNGQTVAAAASERPRRRVLDRFAAYHVADGRACEEAVSRAAALRDTGFEALLCEQRVRWGERWRDADVVVDGDDEIQLAARLALFQLFGSASESGESAIGARGLTGSGYRGHVFWDTDVFVLPVLAATQPALARAALEYRIRRVRAALAEARATGYAGARFPWESARSGRDVTPTRARLRGGRYAPIRTGELEQHVVADVAWAASTYVDWTGDDEFARGPGLSLLTETARFWASRIRRDGDGRGHIERVIGPDEYHEDVDDNAFTNVMARWNLRAAARAAAGGGVAADAELERWLALADSLVDGYDPQTRLYEQYAGFFDLEPLVVAELAPRRPVDAEALLGLERLRGAQVVKQADVLMLHHLVPEEAAAGSLRANLRFYEPRTAHGSSLSPGIHAALFARAGMLGRALETLRLTAQIDLRDLTQTTGSGLHFATMGSLWQALALGFAGLRPHGSELAVDPRLPGSWNGLEVGVRFRGARVRVRIERDALTVLTDRTLVLRVGPRRSRIVAAPGSTRLSRNGQGWREDAA